MGTPLAFGSVEVWATELMKAGILSFAMLRILARRADGRRAVSRRALATAGLLTPILGLIALITLQALPLPSAVIGVVAPSTDALYRESVPGYPGATDWSGVEGMLVSDTTHPALSVAGEGASAPGPHLWRTISLVPGATWERLSLLLAYLLLFYSVRSFASEEPRRMRLLLTVTVTGFVIAAFALIQKLTWNGRIFWVREPRQGGIPFGPFVNPNHFAGYMELVLPVALGLLLVVWRHRSLQPVPMDRPAEAPSSGVVRFPRLEEGRQALFAGWGEAAASKTALVACALLVTVVAIVASGSRGGLMATCITIVLFAGTLVPGEMRRRALLVVMLSTAAVAAAAILASWGVGPLGGTISELAQSGAEPSYATRWINWQAMLPLIRDHLFLGTGLGTFQQAYAGYYPPGVVGVWYQAHNDYLQILIEVGLAGGLLVAVALWRYGRRIVLPALGPGGERGVRVGLIMALLSIALHSVVDFNLQVPSNGFLVVVLAAVLAASVPERRPSPQGLEAGPAAAQSAPARRAAAAALLVLLVWCIHGSARRFFGDREYESGLTALDARQFDLARHRLASAAGWDPGRTEILRKLGDTLSEQAEGLVPGGSGESERRGFLLGGLAAYLGALDAGPTESWSWSGVSSVYSELALSAMPSRAIRLSDLLRGERPALADQGLPPLARRARAVALAACDRAIALEPNNFDYHDERAALLREEGRTEESREETRIAARLLPNSSRHAWGPAASWSEDHARAVEQGMSEAVTMNALAPTHWVWWCLGDVRLQRGDGAGALEAFEKSIAAAPDASTARNTRYYQGEAEWLLQRREAALASFADAAKEPGVEGASRLRMGEALTELGRYEDALEQLRLAATLRPQDPRVRLAIAQAAEAAGKRDLALSSLETAVRLAPADPEPARRLARLRESDPIAAPAAAANADGR